MCIHIVFLIKHLRGLLLNLNERSIQAVFENIRLTNQDSLKELSVKNGIQNDTLRNADKQKDITLILLFSLKYQV